MKKIPVRNINVPQAESGTGFRIQTLKSVLGRKDMTQELHRHQYFYLLFIVNGKGTHEIDFVPHPVKNGCLFFMRPGQVHQLTLRRDCTGYMLQFTGDFLHAHDPLTHHSLSKASSFNYYPLSSKNTQIVAQMLDAVNQEYIQQRASFLDVIKLQLAILCLELSRMVSPSANAAKYYAQERLREFTQLLETNAVSSKQPSFYADRMNLSAYQLNAITKETLGKTSSQVIQDFLVLESKRYLLATSNQVSQVGYELGFEDPSYFIRFFKKHTGYSPEAFRAHFR